MARTVLQRRLASSACAIDESIKRRLQKQQTLLEELEVLSPAQRARRLAAVQGRLPDAEQEEDDLDDETRDLVVDEYTAAVELDQLRREIIALKELSGQSKRVREQASDSKLTVWPRIQQRNAIARVIFAIVSRSDSLSHLDIPCGH